MKILIQKLAKEIIAASRYQKDDEIIWNNQHGIIKSVEKKRDVLKWVYYYVVKLDNGEIHTVNANELKAATPSGRKKVTFKNMRVPVGWEFTRYRSSAYYDQRRWSFSHKNQTPHPDSIIVWALNDDSSFVVEYGLEGTSYYGTAFRDISSSEEASKIAFKLMEKINNNEIEKGFKKPAI